MSDLVDRAKAQLEDDLAFYREVKAINSRYDEIYKPNEVEKTRIARHIRAIEAHLMEIEEHKEGYKRSEGNFGYINCLSEPMASLCVKCSDLQQQPIEYPCSFSVSKSKILLGEE